MNIDPETESLYNAPLTVADHLSQILPRLLVDQSSAIPIWPADVFAIAASLLQRTGAYAPAMDHWPPDGQESTWNDDVRKVGRQWRQQWNQGTFKYLDSHWNTLLSRLTLPIDRISSDTEFLQALVQLCAVADEACDHLGILDSDGTEPETDEEVEFFLQADSLLEESSSLCREIHPSRLRVLPKMHTPQSGLTIRSFSLNLALITVSEIAPKWLVYPSPFGKRPLEILFVPWPRRVDPEDFAPAPPLAHEMRNMPSEFDFFEYDPVRPENPVAYVADLLQRVEASGTNVNAVLLPELALTDSEFEALRELVVDERDKVLIAGVTDISAAGDG